MQQLPPVDWSTAARTGRSLVNPGPELAADEIAQVVSELRDAAERATPEVERVTARRRRLVHHGDRKIFCGRIFEAQEAVDLLRTGPGQVPDRRRARAFTLDPDVVLVQTQSPTLRREPEQEHGDEEQREGEIRNPRSEIRSPNPSSETRCFQTEVR